MPKVLAFNLRLLDTAYEVHLTKIQWPASMFQDGYQATQQIRIDERKQGRRHLIIALTASALEDDAQKCMKAGEMLSRAMSRGKLRYLSLPARPSSLLPDFRRSTAIASPMGGLPHVVVFFEVAQEASWF
jgi:CheY-like chemotaxis protein